METGKTPLGLAFEARDKAVSDLARILGATASTQTSYDRRRAELEALTERLGAANAAIALGEAPATTAASLEKEHRAAVAECEKLLATAGALLPRRDAAQDAVREAKLGIALEGEALAWPVWGALSRDAIDHFEAFLSAVSRRCGLAATITGLFERAGEQREPFDETNVERAQFLGEFNLTVEGLADLLPKYHLKLTRTGLGFLPAGSIPTLSEAELLKLAEAAAKEVD